MTWQFSQTSPTFIVPLGQVSTHFVLKSNFGAIHLQTVPNISKNSTAEQVVHVVGVLT